MNTAYLLTGGNLGNREVNLQMAREWIKKNCGEILVASSLYETAAWGQTDQPAFLNQALCVHTELSATELMKSLLAIEEKMGRIRQNKYGPRIIDIDILLFNNDVIHNATVTIPHPEMHKRRFVLVPLCQIAPMIIHPQLGKPVKTLLAECEDRLPVTLYT